MQANDLLLSSRCDLVVVANGRKEKIASGLLNPFVAHLKVAQEQIAKGGYSITLEPDPEIDAPWFTRGTVERLVPIVRRIVRGYDLQFFL
jgi:hypothetical protein